MFPWANDLSLILEKSREAWWAVLFGVQFVVMGFNDTGRAGRLRLSPLFHISRVMFVEVVRGRHAEGVSLMIGGPSVSRSLLLKRSGYLAIIPPQGTVV